jgi:hypothetical protein
MLAGVLEVEPDGNWFSRGGCVDDESRKQALD